MPQQKIPALEAGTASRSRFGDRLRVLFKHPAHRWDIFKREQIEAIADAIDQDVAELSADRDAWKEQAGLWWGKAIRRRQPADLRQPEAEALVRDLRANAKAAHDRLDGHHREIYDHLAPQLDTLRRNLETQIRLLKDRVAYLESRP